MNVLVAGTIIVIATTILACLGLLAFRKAYRSGVPVESHESPGSLLQVVGTLYAVLLGLLIVHSINKFDEARQGLQKEASAISTIWYATEMFDDTDRQKIQAGLYHFVKDTLEVEFPAMEKHKLSGQVEDDLDFVWSSIKEVSPQTRNQELILDKVYDAAIIIGTNRHNRMSMCTRKASPILWLVIILGAIAILVFTYIYGLKSFGTQLALTCTLAVVLSLNIFLWNIYYYPFSGMKSVSKAPLELLLEDMDWYFNNTHPLNREYLPTHTEIHTHHRM